MWTRTVPWRLVRNLLAERPRRPCGEARGVGEPRLHLPAYEWAPETGEDLSANARHPPTSARSLAPRAASRREDDVSGRDRSPHLPDDLTELLDLLAVERPVALALGFDRPVVVLPRAGRQVARRGR